jgi:hypothetical protein
VNYSVSLCAETADDDFYEIAFCLPDWPVGAELV